MRSAVGSECAAAVLACRAAQWFGSGVNGGGTGGNWFDDGDLDDDRYGNGATVIGPVAVGLAVGATVTR